MLIRWIRVAGWWWPGSTETCTTVGWLGAEASVRVIANHARVATMATANKAATRTRRGDVPCGSVWVAVACISFSFHLGAGGARWGDGAPQRSAGTQRR